MKLKIEQDVLVAPMPWWRRLLSAYWGPEPGMSISAMAWVDPGGPIDLDDVTREVDPHWLVFLNRGIVVNFTDPRPRTREIGGRAFVHRWKGIDSLTVRATAGAEWTTFLISTRQGEELAAELIARGVPLWSAEADLAPRRRPWPRR